MGQINYPLNYNEEKNLKCSQILARYKLSTITVVKCQKMPVHVSTLAPGTLVCHLTIAYISTYICTYTAKGDAKYHNVNITYISTYYSTQCLTQSCTLSYSYINRSILRNQYRSSIRRYICSELPGGDRSCNRSIVHSRNRSFEERSTQYIYVVVYVEEYIGEPYIIHRCIRR